MNYSTFIYCIFHIFLYNEGAIILISYIYRSKISRNGPTAYIFDRDHSF